jgi:hypothetical protein
LHCLCAESHDVANCGRRVSSSWRIRIDKPMQFALNAVARASGFRQTLDCLAVSELNIFYQMAKPCKFCFFFKRDYSEHKWFMDFCNLLESRSNGMPESSTNMDYRKSMKLCVLFQQGFKEDGGNSRTRSTKSSLPLFLGGYKALGQQEKLRAP